MQKKTISLYQFQSEVDSFISLCSINNWNHEDKDSFRAYVAARKLKLGYEIEKSTSNVFYDDCLPA